MMKSKIKIVFISLIVAVCFVSCNKKKNIPDVGMNSIEANINDSLSIKIFFFENHKDFSTVIIKNRNSNLYHIYGFHSDGITPSLIGREKNGNRVGLYYTFYPSGRLNNKINYLNGEIDGDYECYSANGQLQYKAIFEKGVEKSVLIHDSTSVIKIQE